MFNNDSNVHGANMGSIWGWQDPGEPHVGHMNFAILDVIFGIYIWIQFWLIMVQNSAFLLKVGLLKHMGISSIYKHW